MIQFPRAESEVKWTEEEVSRFWDFFATNEHIFRKSYAGEQRSMGFLRRCANAAPSGKWVEVGFGSGRMASLAATRAGISYVGVDTSEESVKRLNDRKLGADISARQGSATNLPFDDNVADAVMAFEVLEHMDENSGVKALREFCRVLKPGGRVIITVPNDERIEESMLSCPRCESVFHRYQHQRKFDNEKLTAHLKSAGFENVVCVNLMGAVGSTAIGNRLRSWIGDVRGKPGESLLAIATAPQ